MASTFMAFYTENNFQEQVTDEIDFHCV